MSDLTNFDELPMEDLEVLIEGLESLEQHGVGSGVSMGDFFGNLVAADNAEEARAIMQARSTEAQNSKRAKKRRVALLKAALIQKQIEREAVKFFSPFTQKS